jgi:hypothetical protein
VGGLSPTARRLLVTNDVEIGLAPPWGTEYSAHTSTNGMAEHPAGSELPGRGQPVGRDALLWQLIESGLIEPDALGDQLAGYNLTAFAQRRLHLLWSINSDITSKSSKSSKSSNSEASAVGLAG